MLTVTSWLWGEKYHLDYVRRLSAGLKRHLRQAHRIVLVTDRALTPEAIGFDEVWPIVDSPLTEVRGCLARLRMFDPKWQATHGIPRGHRLVCVDLDVVVTASLDSLLDRPEPFVILQGANAANPCPYNGSLWLLRGGEHSDVWHDFTFDAAKKVAHHDFPDDQGWMWHKIPNAAKWQAGPDSGVYAFQKPGWPKGKGVVHLPAGARLVAFPGWRDPEQFVHLPWIKEHWTI